MTGAPLSHCWPLYLDGMEEWEMTQKCSASRTSSGPWTSTGSTSPACLPESMMDTTGYTTRWVTNGEMAKIVETNPDRFMYQPNVSPSSIKGSRTTIWELEYWVKEKGAKIFKFYPPEDTYMNDPDIWPFYEKAQELGIVLDIHTGFCWVPPGKSKYALPVQLDDVARDFPDLKINAFHMGYPYCDDLNMIAMQHPNVYVCLSLLVPWAVTAPRKFGKILGEAMRWARSGQDHLGIGLCRIRCQIRGAVDRTAEIFRSPRTCRMQYGYPPITDEDKAKIFGGNLGRLLGIDTTKRRIKTS